MRLMYVTAFNVSCWFEQRLRMSYKPVKPVQNETFEYVDPEGNFKLLAEEVCFSAYRGLLASCAIDESISEHHCCFVCLTLHV